MLLTFSGELPLLAIVRLRSSVVPTDTFPKTKSPVREMTRVLGGSPPTVIFAGVELPMLLPSFPSKSIESQSMNAVT